MTAKLKSMITFRILTAQIPFKYCQKGIEKHILIIKINSQDFETKYIFQKGIKKSELWSHETNSVQNLILLL